MEVPALCAPGLIIQGGVTYIDDGLLVLILLSVVVVRDDSKTPQDPSGPKPSC